MPIIIMNIRSEVGAEKEAIIRKACKAVSLDKMDIISAEIHKTSLDARKRSDIHLVNSVMLCLTSKKLEIELSESTLKSRSLSRKYHQKSVTAG